MSNFTKEQFKKLVYAETAKEEQQSDMKNIMFLLNDEEIISMVRKYHKDNTRCAAVCILDKDQLFDGFVAGYNKILDFFNFKQVKQALDSYNMDTEVCYLFVRNNKITANTIGSSKTEQKKIIH